MITKADVQAFFAKVEAEADEIEDAAEKEVAKGITLASQFLRSTAAALAKDPVLLATLQAGFGVAKAAVLAAVEGGGTSVLISAALEEGKNLLINCGHTAEHELVPIVTAELHAAVAATTQATPTVVNP
jgi:hypothetical protein